jgi:glyoxylase-like metal-dependent hydrolase (beta-lactamase superfamily II)
VPLLLCAFSLCALCCAEGDLLDLGGGAAVIGMPGHTDGSIAIRLPAHRLLFTGDAVAGTPDVGGEPFVDLAAEARMAFMRD